MKTIAVLALLFLPSLLLAADEDEVRQAVQQFYTASDKGFFKPVNFATEDWHHVNPYGGVDRSLEATLNTARAVHTTFLKDVIDTPEDMAVRFASSDVAIATVTSNVSPFTGPDGVMQGPQKHVRTFVVAKRGDRWLIMQDHNTIMTPLPG